MSPRWNAYPSGGAGSSAIDRNPLYFSEPTTLHYAWAVEPEISFVSKDSTRKKSGKNGVGRLVQKLNCAAPHSTNSRQEDRKSERKDLHKHRKREQAQKSVRPWKQSQEVQINKSSWNCALAQVPRATSTSREVLITVNSKGSPDQAVGFHSDFGSSRTSPHGSPSRMITKTSSTMITRPSDAMMTARKERWLKGLQRGYAHDADAPSRISGWDESTASYGHVPTGAGSTTSHDTDFTTEVSSDDSDNYKEHPVLRKRVSNDNNSNNASRRKGSERSRSRNNKSKKNGGGGGSNDLWSGVAEDLGIIAGLLLADGSACVGSVADITRETVADSCKAAPSDSY